MRQRQYSKLFRSISLVLILTGIFALGSWYRSSARSIPSFASQPAAFLTFPFLEGTDVRFAEGWIYCAGEQKIHGLKIHYGTDLSAPRGTPVYAAADGLAIASFDTEINGKYQDKSVGFGYGRFVQVWNSETNTFTIYSHLEAVAPGIYYEDPKKTATGWKPELPKSKEVAESHKNTPIKQGDLIGYVGDSGLTWGYDESPDSRPEPTEFPSWDETHLHIEVFRYNGRGEKEAYDPYGLYEQADKYKIDLNNSRSLWLKDERGQILKPSNPSGEQPRTSPTPISVAP